MNSYEFDWSDLVFGSKKPARDLRATFIAAPRELSTKRFTQIVKKYLPKGNVLLGIAKEDYVLGLEDQLQFVMLQLTSIQSIIDKVNNSSAKHKVYILHYNQRDLVYILEKIPFVRAVFVNGSWYHGFHLRPEYYLLAKQQIPFELVSPFADEAEAKKYVAKTKLLSLQTSGLHSESDMVEIAHLAARHSYDYASFQTAAALGRKKGTKYELLAVSHNQIVPYETYAMYFGSEREKNFSPMHDLNHYDTIHFEVAMLIKAQKQKIDLKDTTLFANVLPCPHCSRMLAATDLAELVYEEDHSGGYAVRMLQTAGKKVRRVTPKPKPAL